MRGVVTDILNNEPGDCYSIYLNVTDEAQRVKITGDEYLLRRAISNLIENSIQHNPDGCAITVAVEKNSTHCLITISDNGVGFPQETLDALKNPESPAATRNHGLGLTIVQQIIKSHGGTVAFNNLPGSACQTVLCLPFN